MAEPRTVESEVSASSVPSSLLGNLEAIINQIASVDPSAARNLRDDVSRLLASGGNPTQILAGIVYLMLIAQSVRNQVSANQNVELQGMADVAEIEEQYRALNEETRRRIDRANELLSLERPLTREEKIEVISSISPTEGVSEEVQRSMSERALNIPGSEAAISEMQEFPEQARQAQVEMETERARNRQRSNDTSLTTSERSQAAIAAHFGLSGTRTIEDFIRTMNPHFSDAYNDLDAASRAQIDGLSPGGVAADLEAAIRRTAAIYGDVENPNRRINALNALNTGRGSAEALADAAAINTTSPLISNYILRSMADRTNELVLSQVIDRNSGLSQEARAEILQRQLSSSIGHTVPADQLSALALNAVREYDDPNGYNGSIENLRNASNAKVNQSANKISRDTLGTAMRLLGELNTQEGRDATADAIARRTNMSSFFRQEIEGALGRINSENPELARAIGGRDGLNADEYIRYLQSAGVLREWRVGQESREEYSVYAMSVLDSNRDGQLETNSSTSELTNALRSARDLNVNRNTPNRVQNFAENAADRASDALAGQGAFGQAIAAKLAGYQNTTWANMRGADGQKIFDIDGDGNVELYEVRRVLEANGVRRTADIDANGDGEVTRDEMRAVMQRIQLAEQGHRQRS